MTGREQVRFTCPCHRTCPPFVQSSLYRPTNINSPPPLFFYYISFHSVQQPIFHLGRNFLKFLQFRVKLEIWRNATVLSTLENPCLSKFLNPSPLRSEIGHLFHPSIHPRFPHFRFAMHGASFPSPLRSPLWWTGAQDTRGEGAKLRKRRKATAGNATKCEVRWAHTKEGTARVERAGAIGRNLPLRPEKGTKRKKRASWERWGVKCNRKRYLRRVWFFHHTGLLLYT